MNFNLMDLDKDELKAFTKRAFAESADVWDEHFESTEFTHSIAMMSGLLIHMGADLSAAGLEEEQLIKIADDFKNFIMLGHRVHMQF